MKNLRNYVILSVVIVLAILVGMAQGVNASGTVLFPSATTTDANATTANATTTDANATTTNTATSTTNSLIVNNINSNVAKENETVNTTTTTVSTDNSNLPQTGENDVYIVSAIGAVALAIGSIAYFKSRRYDI